MPTLSERGLPVPSSERYRTNDRFPHFGQTYFFDDLSSEYPILMLSIYFLNSVVVYCTVVTALSIMCMCDSVVWYTTPYRGCTTTLHHYTFKKYRVFLPSPSFLKLHLSMFLSIKFLAPLSVKFGFSFRNLFIISTRLNPSVVPSKIL